MATNKTIRNYRQVIHNGSIARLHRVRAEQALGRVLPIRAVVHHADGTRRDDSPLVICQDAAYHALLHLRMRVKAAGGNPNTDAICKCCRHVKRLSEFNKCRTRPRGHDPVCRQCRHQIDSSRPPRLR